MPPDVKIIHIGQTGRWTVAGVLENVYRVQFMVGQSGPFAVEIPQGLYTADKVQAEIEKVAAVVRALVPPTQ